MYACENDISSKEVDGFIFFHIHWSNTNIKQLHMNQKHFDVRRKIHKKHQQV
jgi:hypothetical protein